LKIFESLKELSIEQRGGNGQACAQCETYWGVWRYNSNFS